MDDLLVNVPITEQRRVRSEILVGPERHRRWNLSEKRRIVAESLAPGAVSSAVARRYGIHPNQLCDWRRAFKRAAAEMTTDFVPISVASVPPPALAPSEAGPIGQIEIIIGTVTVRVPNGVDGSTLRRVVAALKGV